MITSPPFELESHETICLPNAGDEDACIEVMVYFADHEPAGPYRYVPARRTSHLRFNDFKYPMRKSRGY